MYNIYILFLSLLIMNIMQKSSKRLYYTGVGSRKTPPDICASMKEIAGILEKKGYILRTGDAKGADDAFISGLTDFSSFREFYAGYTTEKSRNIALKYHPNPGAALKWINLLGRNPFQVLGKDLKKPSKFMICWTPEGKKIGGTGLTIRIAEAYKVPVYNLYDLTVHEVMEEINKL